MSKLDETLTARNVARENLLRLRGDLASNMEALRQLEVRCDDIHKQIGRETAKLVQLTNDANQLMHADLAGLVPRPKGDAPSATLATHSELPAP
jgi:hypothetical protein